jgi:hypothetical protein
MIGRSLVDFIHNGYCTFTINDPAKRGIGGIGMGAYGAFRAAMLNPGVFTSVSAVDGPLDFDGSDGSGGFVDYFDDCIAEQGITSLDDFDSCYANPLTQMLIGGSMAFSPHDTLVSVFISLSGDPTRPPDVNILSREVITDTETLIDHIILGDDHFFHFHLPFDATGSAYAPIWEDCWLPNNLENILSTHAGALDNVDMWVATSPEARLGFHEQTSAWISTLQGAGLTVDATTYSGYSDHPANFDEYLYDLMREMLIFHSESFGD